MCFFIFNNILIVCSTMDSYYNKNTYQLFLIADHNVFTELDINCSGIKIEQMSLIRNKLLKCKKLKTLILSNITNQYFDKLNFNFLADFATGDIEISSTYPFYQITNFVTDTTLVILASLQTNLNIDQIFSTNFKFNTKIYVRSNKFTQVATIMNNLNTNVHNLKIHFISGRGDSLDEFRNFITVALNNLPFSLENLKIYYKMTILNRKFYNKVIELFKNIKTPFGCNLIVKDYRVKALTLYLHK